MIPDYQIAYAWEENECRTLWNDIFSFAIPDEGRTELDSNSEYFLGPIVTFKNDDDKMEVIDGQQRLLLLIEFCFYKWDIIKILLYSYSMLLSFLQHCIELGCIFFDNRINDSPNHDISYNKDCREYYNRDYAKVKPIIK